MGNTVVVFSVCDYLSEKCSSNPDRGRNKKYLIDPEKSLKFAFSFNFLRVLCIFKAEIKTR